VGTFSLPLTHSISKRVRSPRWTKPRHQIRADGDVAPLVAPSPLDELQVGFQSRTCPSRWPSSSCQTRPLMEQTKRRRFGHQKCTPRFLNMPLLRLVRHQKSGIVAQGGRAWNSGGGFTKRAHGCGPAIFRWFSRGLRVTLRMINYCD
jgi:hypothetical protein